MSQNEEKQLNLPQREEKMLEFWEAHNIFDEVLKKHAKGKRFVFYEGPPTANGMPGIHHVLARAFKDVVLRFKTMRGFFVPRRAGWDTHGLPVEVEIEKKLGFKTKRDIENYGIAPFNKLAKESVWKYKDEWERFTRRMGFWLDMGHPYITYETSYIESLWAIIKKISDQKLLYRDFKVIPWCPRCETGLSSHEVGQGYKKVNDTSVFVKFPIRGKKDEFLLVWTTTPWTLPANVAIAVNPKLEYVKYKVSQGEKTEYIWSAKTPPSREGEEISVVEKVSGNALKSWKYEGLYKVLDEYVSPKQHAKPPYEVILADFVSAEEGTGMVHLAPSFGEEDMAAMRNYDNDLFREWKSKGRIYQRQHRGGVSHSPVLETVEPNGTMKKGIIGEGKFVKDADKDIIEDLKKRNQLFSVLPYEHEYPFCWRCQTPLIYFARQAWWIGMSRIREKLLDNNEKVNWIPAHIKHGRFGEFLKEVRDWAFSRERFWGTPLPVWECAECGERKTIGALAELESLTEKARNTYVIMRHGESTANVKHIVASSGEDFPLTKRGKVQALRAAKALRRRGIDLIVSSPVLRAKETAESVAATLGIKEIKFDKRLAEINVGVFDGRDVADYHHYFRSLEQKFEKEAPDGESLADVRRRTFSLLQDLEKTYQGKTILLVSHEYPLWMLYAAAQGYSKNETITLKKGKKKEDFIAFAEARNIAFRVLPRNDEGEVNLHRPYVDEIRFSCGACKKGTMCRVSEVVDVWFDSGAMPFAQDHWLGREKIFYPADYICEAVDQTRGWFYSLLAVGTLLGKEAPYKTVISLGHLLDKNGQKMSKSKGNVVDPNIMMQKYGADVLRWFFYTVNPPGEPKRFDEKELFNKLRAFHGILWNINVFFDTYVSSRVAGEAAARASRNILDQWIIARTDMLVAEVTEYMEKYDMLNAARTIEEFTAGDFSQWYLRRSRRRFQHPESESDKKQAASTLGFVLLSLTTIIAPFAPFFAEALYQELRKKMKLKEVSVHLCDWPRPRKLSSQSAALLGDMDIVRKTVAEALKIRAEAGIKVRQPLGELRIAAEELEGKKELLRLILAEVNVKDIAFGNALSLDTTITSELREEGTVRELIRNVQELRKDLGLHPRDAIRLQAAGGAILDPILDLWKDFIKKETGARMIAIGGKKIFKAEREVEIEGSVVWIGIS
ncbi:MAG: class I tRNA ligase family protein [Candidatus Sungbacteria bacterium]|nr:class I tRNA ligase family protein [Candidatus Sungbacteria bacterium]